jgi:hypothetical protein
VKQFEQLHIEEQNQLLLSLLGLIADSGISSIARLAEKEGCSVRDVWREVCADADLDECEPWQGFPGFPKHLPPAPGGDRPLSGEVSDALDRLGDRLTRKN